MKHILGKHPSNNTNNGKVSKKNNIITKKEFSDTQIKKNGTVKSTISYQRKNYFNDKTKEYLIIDNTLVETQDYYQTKANDVITKINKKITNGEIFSLEKDKYKITLISLDMINKNSMKSLNTKKNNHSQSIVSYKNFKESSDLEYIISNNQIKENIIVNSKQENYSYPFQLEIKNLEISITDDAKNLLLLDKTTKQSIFTIPAPVMFDSNKNISRNICFEIEQINEETVAFNLIADEKWINDETREFPVTIDPQIVFNETTSYEIKYYELLSNATSSASTDFAWQETTPVSDHVYLDSTKKIIFSIPKELINSVAFGPIIRINLFLGDTTSGVCTINGNTTYINTSLDITDLFLNNSNEIIIELIGINDVTNDFIVDLNTDNYITVEYASADFVQQKIPFSIVNNNSLIYDLNFNSFSVSISDSHLLPIQHIFIENNNEYSCGKNWKLNYHQTLTKQNNIYVYSDEYGDKHVFEDKYYYLENGKPVYLSIDEVTFLDDGSMIYTDNWFQTNVSRVLTTPDGLKLHTKLPEIYSTKYIDQRTDELKKIEQSIYNYKNSIRSIILFDLSTKTQISSIDQNPTLQNIKNLLELKNDNTIFLDFNSYSSLKTLLSVAEPSDSELMNKQHIIEVIAPHIEETLKTTYGELLLLEAQKGNCKRLTPVSFITRNNNVLCFNEEDKLCAIMDSENNTTQIVWDKINNLSETYNIVKIINDKLTISLNYEFDKLMSIVTHDGLKIKYEYDYNDSLYKLISKNDNLTIEYDGYGNIINIHDNNGNLTRLDYDENSILQKIENSYFDSKNEVRKTISCHTFEYYDYYLIINDNTSSSYYIFDNNNCYCSYIIKNDIVHDLKFFHKANGNYSINVIPKKNNEIIISNSEVDEIIREYFTPNLQSLPGLSNEYSTFIEADWTYTTYDELFRIKKETSNWKLIARDPATQKYVFSKNETTYEYDDSFAMGPCHKKTTYTYINFDETKSTNTSEVIIKNEVYLYNNQNNLVRKESYFENQLEKGTFITEYIYDENGKMIKEISYNSLDSSSKFVKDILINENKKSYVETNEFGDIINTFNFKDNSSLVDTIIDYNGNKFSYGYDSNNQITSISKSTKQGVSNYVNREYNQLGLITKLSSDNVIVNYEYDHLQRIIKVTVNENQTNFTYKGGIYDDINNETYNEIEVESTTITSNNDTYKTYFDKNGNEIAYLINDTTQYSNTFDNTNNKLLTSLDNITSILTSYDYDPSLKNIKDISLKKDNDIELNESYTYNKYNQLAIKTLNGKVNHTYSYFYKDSTSKELEYVLLPNNIKCYMNTDLYNRNIGKTFKSNNQNIYEETISYCKHGNRTSLLPNSIEYKLIDDNKFVKSDTITYDYNPLGTISHVYENGILTNRYIYDNLNRLVREDNKKFNKSYYHNYDKNGNILSRYTSTYSLNENINSFDEEVLYTYDNDKLYSCNNKVITYDNNYPTKIGDKVTIFTNGKLTKYDSTSFTYDGYGRRLTKNNINYFYDSNNRLIKQYDDSSYIEFIYIQNQLIGLNVNGTHYLYGRNILGDITHILSLDGEIVARYDYDAWGNHIVSNLTPSNIGDINPFRYRGYYYDVETQFYWVSSRYYSPELCRWISPDSIEYLDPESINGLNLYAYCGNDPINNYDLTGHFSLPNWAKWVIGGVAFAGAVALTIVTGGALAPVFIGMGVSIASSALIGGAISAYNGDGFWSGFADGAADGAMWGGIFALAGATIGAIRYGMSAKGAVKGTQHLTTISKGQQFDRFGRLTGKYITDIGTPASKLALPAANTGVKTSLQATRNFRVITGIVADAFGRTGGGTQYVMRYSIEKLIEMGWLIII